MISVELEHLEGRLAQSPKIQVGRRFMSLLRSEGILELSTGYHPAILGGAVRDTFFDTGHEVQDIDIFLFKDDRNIPSTRSLRSITSPQDDLNNFYNNLLVWLEDEGISWNSRLSTQAANYFGGQRFLDIVEFEWENTTIQLMIPNHTASASGIDNLLRQMPIYSGMCITQRTFISYNSSFASQFFPAGHYPVATDRDLPYLRHKYPEGSYVNFRNSSDLTMYALGRDIAIAHTIEGSAGRVTSLTENSAENLISRKVLSHFNLRERNMLVISNSTSHLVHNV